MAKIKTFYDPKMDIEKISGDVQCGFNYLEHLRKLQKERVNLIISEMENGDLPLELIRHWQKCENQKQEVESTIDKDLSNLCSRLELERVLSNQMNQIEKALKL